MNKFYLTTPIYYINDRPHIGHAYTTIVADAIAKYQRTFGKDVYFLTGTDENSQKNIQAAERILGKVNLNKEEVQKYLDEMSAIWQRTWDELKITNNDFIRTTEERHIKAVRVFFTRVWESGDIYKGVYEGYYCDGCEAFVNESDLVDGKCPIHKTEAKKLKEENYFFRLTKYRDKLLEHIEKNSEFIQPQSRKNEVVSYIKDFMSDVSITRESLKWGIPMPEVESEKHASASIGTNIQNQVLKRGTSIRPSDSFRTNIQNQVLYVWFDALINYISGIGYGADEEKFNNFWPADLHLVGKDIIKFHSALWPAMLLSAGLPLPKQIFAHGFFTIEGEKMSKSLGNIVDPVEIAKRYGHDALRYYLLREIPFGEDGDFSISRLEERYNSDLANGLGNLVSRVFVLANKHIEKFEPQLAEVDFSGFWQKYDELFKELKIHQVLSLIWEEIAKCDKIIDEKKPWELAKTDLDGARNVLYELLERIRHIAFSLYPFLTDSAERILLNYGIVELERGQSFQKSRKWGGIKDVKSLKVAESLFPRI